MHVTSISSIGSRRLLHKGTKELHFKPKAQLQLVIGMNGYGKSTLLDLTSPLPPSQKEFVKGGSLIREIQHNDSKFVLTSDFKKGNHHSFVKDGQELNDGGTLTIQKQLVEQHLNYTPEIHQLLLGKVKFTQLTVQKRKEWLVRLCQTDVSYAMSLYSRLSAANRKLASTKEHLEKKLIDETSKLMSAEQFEDLMSQIKAIADEDTEIISNIGFADWTDSHVAKYKALEKSLADLSAKVFEFMPATHLYSSAQVLEDTIFNKTELVNSKASNLSTLKGQYESLSDAVSQMESVGEQSVAELKAELDQLTFDLSQFHNETAEDVKLDIEAILTDCYSIKDRVNNLLLKLPKNLDMALFNRSTIGAKKNELSTIQSLIDQSSGRKASSEARLVELKSHDLVECVNCKHRWVPGLSEDEVKRHERQIERSLSELVELEQKKEAILEWLRASEEWVSQYKQYTDIYSSHPRLEPLFDLFLEDNRIFNCPDSLVGMIDNYIVRMLQAREYRKIHTRSLLVSHALQQKELIEGSNVSMMTEKLNSLITDIEILSHVQHAEKAELKQLTNYSDKVKAVYDLSMQISNALAEHGRLTVQQAKAQLNTELKAMLSSNSEVVRDLNETISDARSRISIVNHLRDTIDELRLDVEASNALLAELSPTDGLIADTLGGFGNALASQMNSIINRIWSTPLIIKPCAVADGDLDYQFPLSSQDSDYEVADISMGSDGELEIVDFAFMMVARTYLGLNKYPLHMDEVGKAFHDAHKVSMYSYVKQLMEAGLIGQVFVISHSPTAHATLTHADVNVMDPTGIMVTPGANENLTLV